MFTFDHLAVSCTDLDEGVAAVEAALGVTMGPGGQHPHFGTHNRLLSLGGTEYLEVIAIDPAAPAPAYPRWFDIDNFSGATRLSNWILSCEDLSSAIERTGAEAGLPVPLRRGDYCWQMAVPPGGRLPFDNLHPALIEWQGPHPAPNLPASGCTLSELVVSHPQAAALETRLGLNDARIRFEAGPPALRASIATLAGLRVLA